MIKVFVVDDEMLIRMGIKMIADWEKNGIEISGEASNGSEALKKIKDTQPDIVITDLKMPIMDGITLIKELRNIKFRGKIIVLSNYNEFELVKEAMKNGASEYLLKLTLRGDELVKVIHSLSEDLISQHKKENDDTRVKIVLNENRNVIKEKFINDLRYNSLQEKEITDKIAIHELRISSSNAVIAAIADDIESAIGSLRIIDEGLLNFTIQNIIDEVINRKFNGEVFHLKDWQFIILIDSEDSRLKTSAEKSICGICNEMKVLLKRYINLDMCFIYKKVFVGIQGTGDAINRILSGMELRFYSEEPFIMDIDNGYSLLGEMDPEFWRLKSDLKEAVDAVSEETEIILGQICGHIFTKRYGRAVIKQIYRNLVTLVEEIVTRENGDLYKVIDRRFIAMTESSLYLAVFKNNLLTIFRKALEYITLLRNENFRDEVVKAINYIKANYREKISLEDVSSFVNMNKNYFCKLFKEETGVSPVEYIIRYKMERAKELLKSENMNVSEVSKFIGYDDVSYFNKLFKRHAGVSPGSYVK